MFEVTIPLRPVKDNELGNPDDYFKIIREEYTARYLEMLNIASTPANKAEFMRCRMMDDCDMVGVWPDLRTSALADAVRIVPPLRQRIGDLSDLNESDKATMAQWYGQADPICVRPPDIDDSALASLRLLMEEDDGSSCTADMSNEIPSPSAEIQSPVGRRAEFAAELERVRIGAANVEATKRIGAGRIDAEKKERLLEELASLKAKFILPYACERTPKEGSVSGASKKAELVAWPMNGPLVIDMPESMWHEALQPIRCTLEDVRKNTGKWIEDSMPLEFLTSRRFKDDVALNNVRATLKEANVARLIGLLAHLLHWLALMPVRKTGAQLSEQALQSMFVAIHEHWSQYEKLYRDSKWGVSFVLPCIVLTLKTGIERIFEISYPNVMSQEGLRQLVIDRINTLLMRLFDPDSAYSRFGKFDGEGKAILLSKKLDAMMKSAGSSHCKRLQARMHRSTPLVRAVIGFLGSEGQHGDIADTRTRMMLMQSDSSPSSVVHPPQDKAQQAALYKAVRNRIPFQDKSFITITGESRLPLSARQSQAIRKRDTQIGGPRSARATAISGGGAQTVASGTGGTLQDTTISIASSTTSGVGGLTSMSMGQTAWSGAVTTVGDEPVAMGTKLREKLPVLPRPTRKLPV
mmetsp:Transcript_84196/g.132977  ORF Transcript_84196/g.132977 Transcript_84196/m.132977 type:complete len:637 (-) Transcript_84196:72-1982(-)